MALWSTQPLTEMSTMNVPGGIGRGAENLTAMCEPIVQIMWELRRLTTLNCFPCLTLPLHQYLSNMVYMYNL
jgi:hypothetical protein